MTETETQYPATIELAVEPATATNNGLNAVTYLMELLDQKPKKVMINGKRHIEFDDWVILGNFYGIDVQTGEAEPVEVFGVKGAKAKAQVIKIEDGGVIGGAEAYCMMDEPNWRNKPFFQLASMAQTRAGSKALANVLRGFVALKGISGTPAEEMVNNRPQGRQGQNRNVRPVKKPATRRPTAKPKEETPPAGIDPSTVQDAETTPKPETEQVDMTNGDRVNLAELKGINEELDKWIEMTKDVGPTTRREVLETCQDLLGNDEITKEEFREVKKKMGMKVK